VTAREDSSLEARYANHFEIGFSAHEFVLDCGQFYEEHKEPRLHTRLVTGPAYVKEFLSLLKQAVTDYEREHGPIARPKPGPEVFEGGSS
jgi:hypothetical protein